jgi:hypothetical protein
VNTPGLLVDAGNLGKGSSGGPVWVYDGKTFEAVGVHVGAHVDDQGNPLPGEVSAQLTPDDIAEILSWEALGVVPQIATVTAQNIQSDYVAMTRAALPLDQATTVANSISAGTQTEAQYINSLLFQVADTTIPAVAVEGSMYNAVGTSVEVTALATQFLPPQVANALKNGLDPQVYATEALGLVFAFGNENHPPSTAFADNFGPSNPSMPNTSAGDAAFASAISNIIFGSGANAHTPDAIAGFVANWKAFYSSNGIPGIPTPTATQVDVAARGAAWGDAMGVALGNSLGPWGGLTTNFLEDAAQGTAVYSASLSSQPAHAPFQGASSATSSADAIQLTGIPVTSTDPLLAHAI